MTEAKALMERHITLDNDSPPKWQYTVAHCSTGRAVSANK